MFVVFVIIAVHIGVIIITTKTNDDDNNSSGSSSDDYAYKSHPIQNSIPVTSHSWVYPTLAKNNHFSGLRKITYIVQ